MVQVTDEQLEATADGSGAVSVVSTAAFAGATQAVAQVSKRTEQPVDASTLTLTCRISQTGRESLCRLLEGDRTSISVYVSPILMFSR